MSIICVRCSAPFLRPPRWCIEQLGSFEVNSQARMSAPTLRPASRMSNWVILRWPNSLTTDGVALHNVFGSNYWSCRSEFHTVLLGCGLIIKAPLGRGSPQRILAILTQPSRPVICFCVLYIQSVGDKIIESTVQYSGCSGIGEQLFWIFREISFSFKKLNVFQKTKDFFFTQS